MKEFIINLILYMEILDDEDGIYFYNPASAQSKAFYGDDIMLVKILVESSFS